MKNYNNYIIENKKEDTLVKKIEKEFFLKQIGEDIDKEIRALIDIDINKYTNYTDISDGIQVRIKMAYFSELFGFSSEYIEDYDIIRAENHYNYTLEEMKWSDLDKIESYDKTKKLFGLSDGVLFRFLDKIVPELKTQFKKYSDIIITTNSDAIFNNFKRIEDELPYQIKMSSDYSDVVLDCYYDKMNKFQATTIKELINETKYISSQIETIHKTYLNDKEEKEFIDKLEPIFDEIYEYMKENKTEILNNINIEKFLALHAIGGEFWNHLNTYEYQDNFINNLYRNYKILIDKQGVGLGEIVFKIDDKIKEKYDFLLKTGEYDI